MNSLHETSIADIQDMLKVIYGKKNAEKEYDYLYGYLVKNLFRPRDRGMNNPFIKSISYLMGIASYFDINLQDAFLRKFPEICPYCLSAPCICSITGKKSKIQSCSIGEVTRTLDDKYRSLLNDKSVEGDRYKYLTFEFAFDIIQRVYPNNAFDWMNHGNMFHIKKMGEEISELHEASCRFIMQNKDKSSIAWKSLKDEIADVFVWCLSEWGLTCGGSGMTDEFRKYYKDSCCSGCGHKECVCKTRFERNQSLTADHLGSRTLVSLNYFIEHHKPLPSKIGDEINYAVSELNAAMNTGTERLIIHAVDKAVKAIRNSGIILPSDENNAISDIENSWYFGRSHQYIPY